MASKAFIVLKLQVKDHQRTSRALAPELELNMSRRVLLLWSRIVMVLHKNARQGAQHKEGPYNVKCDTLQKLKKRLRVLA